MEIKSINKEVSFTKRVGMKKIIDIYPKEIQKSTAFIIEEIMEKTSFGKTKTLALIKELEENKDLSDYQKRARERGHPSNYYYLTKPKKEILDKIKKAKLI